jgi:hypothetical protein
MGIDHGHGDAGNAITAVEAIQRQLETAIVGFIAIAAAEGWTPQQIDADLQRFGYGLELRLPTGARRRH